jgi:type I restriction enzyme, S subunit
MTRQPAVQQTERRLTKEGIASKRLPVGRKGTVLFAMYASVGAVSVLETEASWNQAILGMEPMASVAERRFLVYWLLSLRPQLERYFRSNTQDNLNAEQVGNLPYPILSVVQQGAIADFLDTETARIDALIAKKHRLMHLLGTRLATMARSLIFTQTNVKEARLGRVVSILPGYAFSSSDFRDDGEDAVRLLRGINVAPGRCRWGEVAYLPKSQMRQHQAYALSPGDLVLGMDRPFISEGTRLATIKETDVPALLVQRVARIRAKEARTYARTI